MQEARASWNTIYVDREGFECQLTLRDEDENALAERVAAITKRIKDSGGKPVVRGGRNGRQGNGRSNRGGSSGGGASGKSQAERTYVDEKGVRRCNLELKSGKRCDQPVTEREGRYGLFWACPDYKNHA